MATEHPTTSGSALGGIRVLDLTDEKGVYCGKILADMGADVIKIEPPQGDPMRRQPPFVDDIPGPELSLYWLHYNTNKRGITLKLDCADGKAVFKRLAEKADIILETFRPGYLASLGIDYAQLSSGHPELIMASITNFGQEGPYRDYEAGDLVGSAMGGYVYPHGFPGSPPVKIFGQQAYHVTGHHAGIAVLLALFHRLQTGQGQSIDVSMQSAVAASTQMVNVVYIYQNRIPTRLGPKHIGMATTMTFPSKDGYVAMAVGAIWNRLLDWMEREGMVGDLRDPKYADREVRNAEDDHIAEVISDWSRTHERQELMDWGQGNHLPVGNAYTGEQLMHNPQLEARGFYVPVEHPEFGRTITYPGAIYEFSETPWQLRRRAPQLAEHNVEVYSAELGLTKADLVVLASNGVI